MTLNDIDAEMSAVITDTQLLDMDDTQFAQTEAELHRRVAKRNADEVEKEKLTRQAAEKERAAAQKEIDDANKAKEDAEREAVAEKKRAEAEKKRAEEAAERERERQAELQRKQEEDKKRAEAAAKRKKHIRAKLIEHGYSEATAADYRVDEVNGHFHIWKKVGTYSSEI